jgi:hypothetical protein
MTLLTPAHIATVMALLLCEQKVVVHCTVASSAGDVAIALRTLLFPLRWELFFIPLVPVNMLGFLGACARACRTVLRTVGDWAICPGLIG